MRTGMKVKRIENLGPLALYKGPIVVKVEISHAGRVLSVQEFSQEDNGVLLVSCKVVIP